MINITVKSGENVFDAVARGLNTRMDYRLDNPFSAPVYRVDTSDDGPRHDESPMPVATVSSHRWTYNVYRYEVKR